MYFNNIYYEKHGTNKKKILILPGWGNTRYTFNLMINQLKKDYTVYIIDYPGFGNSIFPDRDLNIYDYANMVKDFMKYEKINNPIIIAHSFGGRISSILIGKYKLKVEKLILIDVAGIKRRKSMFKIIKQYTYKLLKKISIFISKRKRNIYLKKLIKVFGSNDYKNLNSNMYNTFKNIINEDLKKYIKNINTNTLIIWGKKDKDTKLKEGKIYNELIDNSKLIIIPNASHFPYLNYPNMINDIIYKYIKND